VGQATRAYTVWVLTSGSSQRATAAGIASVLLMLTGCSGGASTSGSPASSVAAATPSPTPGVTATMLAATAPPPGSIRVEMVGPPPRYRPDKLTAHPGVVVFFLVNLSQGVHTLAIGPKVGDFLVVSDPVLIDHPQVFTVSGLKPGSYAIWCTVDSHAEEGMVGTLTVGD
jgi:plastocyanin